MPWHCPTVAAHSAHPAILTACEHIPIATHVQVTHEEVARHLLVIDIIAEVLGDAHALLRILLAVVLHAVILSKTAPLHLVDVGELSEVFGVIVHHFPLVI